MHDGSFLGLQGVHQAEIVGFGPDHRPQVVIPALGETVLLARSLVEVPSSAVGRLVAVTMMDDQPLAPVLEVDGDAVVVAPNEVILRCGRNTAG